MLLIDIGRQIALDEDARGVDDPGQSGRPVARNCPPRTGEKHVTAGTAPLDRLRGQKLRLPFALSVAGARRPYTDVPRCTSRSAMSSMACRAAGATRISSAEAVIARDGRTLVRSSSRRNGSFAPSGTVLQDEISKAPLWIGQSTSRPPGEITGMPIRSYSATTCAPSNRKIAANSRLASTTMALARDP